MIRGKIIAGLVMVIAVCAFFTTARATNGSPEPSAGDLTIVSVKEIGGQTSTFDITTVASKDSR